MPIAWAALLGYGIGSLPLGFLVARAGGVDIRRAGSGNVGAANVYRTAGRGLGVLVMLLDVAKGAFSVITTRALMAQAPEAGAAIAGLAAIVGHIYPLSLRFKGGKGVAAACGVFLMLAPWATLGAALVFVATAWLTRYISLASVAATVALPAIHWLQPGDPVVDAVAIAAAALILFRHRGNLARLVAGSERRFGDASERTRA